VITEVFRVVTEQWRVIFGILLFSALSQGLVIITLKRLYRDKLSSIEYFSLGLAGWMLPIFLISILWLLLGFTSSAALSRLVIPVSIFVLLAILFRLKLDPEPDSKKYIFFLLAFVLVSILVRLVFASRAIFPSYFDSAQHYSIIKNILQHGSALSLASSTYYHSGFHVLTAFLVTVLNADAAKAMLILGQMALALMPVSLFFLLRYITGSNIAGIFTVILAAFGWYMPAHAVNWGKYPALMSLALLPFVLSLAYLLTQNRVAFARQHEWKHYIILGLSVVSTILLHSRSLIILTVIFLAWVIATWLGGLSFRNRWLVFIALLIALALGTLFIQKQAVFGPLFDPYLRKGFWITALILLLSVFALKEHSRVVFACLLSMAMLLGGLFLPIQVPGYGSLTLLDRPLVEMILYLPLSLLGGLGLASLENLLTNASFWKLFRKGYILAFMMGLIVIHALVTYDFYPSDCCVLVGNDDREALAWMDTHLPGEAQIGISVTELNVLPSDALEGYSGGDAGIWITPLIERATVPLFFSSDFGQEDVRNLLCQSGVTHLYVGQLGRPFELARLQEHPEWYKVLLSTEQVKVYEVIGCG